jgi:hypothetical protein
MHTIFGLLAGLAFFIVLFLGIGLICAWCGDDGFGGDGNDSPGGYGGW